MGSYGNQNTHSNWDWDEDPQEPNTTDTGFGSSHASGDSGSQWLLAQSFTPHAPAVQLQHTIGFPISNTTGALPTQSPSSIPQIPGAYQYGYQQQQPGIGPGPPHVGEETGLNYGSPSLIPSDIQRGPRIFCTELNCPSWFEGPYAQGSLARHLTVVHNYQNASTIYCPAEKCRAKYNGKSATANLERHRIEKHTGKYPYPCEECGKTITSTFVLNTHRQKGCGNTCSASDQTTLPPAPMESSEMSDEHATLENQKPPLQRFGAASSTPQTPHSLPAPHPHTNPGGVPQNLGTAPLHPSSSNSFQDIRRPFANAARPRQNFNPADKASQPKDPTTQVSDDAAPQNQQASYPSVQGTGHISDPTLGETPPDFATTVATSSLRR